jgi:hypothetical protein
MLCCRAKDKGTSAKAWVWHAPASDENHQYLKNLNAFLIFRNVFKKTFLAKDGVWRYKVQQRSFYQVIKFLPVITKGGVDRR